MPKPKSSDPIEGAGFLRSINLRLDADAPDRIAHFHPTSKSVALLSAICGERGGASHFVVAPYGTGKSLAATYLLHLIENRPESREALKQIHARFANSDEAFVRFAQSRIRSRKRSGLVLALQGHVEDLPQALASALDASLRREKRGRQARALQGKSFSSMEEFLEALTRVRNLVRGQGVDRICILWDEFGRHIEGLISTGRADSLNDIQVLSEYAARTSAVPTTIGLLLHQGLMHYATSVSQRVRAEWMKIEGRFETIQYLDDSKELYQLFANMLDERSPEVRVTKARIAKAAASAKAIGFFKEFSKAELADLLQRAKPVMPATLELLPRLSGRIAQNERTVFSFLHDLDIGSDVTPAELYDSFGAAMQADIGVGGTYRRWIETESALSKVAGDVYEERVLKCACLLGLGVSGGRSGATRPQVEFAAQGYTADGDVVRAAVDSLIEKRLILHRLHSDELTVWHGADVDLRSRLAEVKEDLRPTFELATFLDKEASSPSWRPVSYNAKYAIRRHFDSRFVAAEVLEGAMENCRIELERGGRDGTILYVIPADGDDLEAASQIARTAAADNRMLIAIPREPLPILEMALEVAALRAMQSDSQLTAKDPLVLPELHQLEDDARRHLSAAVQNLCIPHASRGPRWFLQGEEQDIGSPRALRERLALLCHEVFPLTPRINNENIVRRRPTAISVNSRKKLLLAVLERSGQEGLGIKGDFPDASMFRTVLLHTGLYRQDARSGWGYAEPQELKDRGLKKVWGLFSKFFRKPSRSPKEFGDLFEKLMSPPFGIRQGVLPILVGAATRAFPSTASLLQDGVYVGDVLPTTIEDLCKNPERYRLEVFDFSGAEGNYLVALGSWLQSRTDTKGRGDLVRDSHDALVAWQTSLPPSALGTAQVSEHCRRVQVALRTVSNPVDLFLEALPEAVDCSTAKWRKCSAEVIGCFEELAGISDLYLAAAAAAVERAVALRSSGQGSDLRRAASGWAECFPEDFVASLTDGMAKGVVTRMRMSYRSDDRLVDSLASLLVGKTTGRWDDSTLAAFDRSLHDVIHRVEESALASGNGVVHGDAALRSGVPKLLEERLRQLFLRYVQIGGTEAGKELLRSLASEEPRKARRGKAKRGTG